jgi:high-affinity nickel permease
MLGRLRAKAAERGLSIQTRWGCGTRSTPTTSRRSTTPSRKAMNQRQDTSQPRPFAFGHSTILMAIGVGIIIAEKTVLPAVTHSNSSLESFGGTFGTIVSAAFLFLIGLLNLVILGGIIRVFRSMRRGEYDEAELERQRENRGFFYRFFCSPPG